MSTPTSARSADVQQTWTVPAIPANIGKLRAAVAAFAAAQGVPGHRLPDLKLAVSEALTNAVVHAYRDGHGGELHVTARSRPDGIEVIVEDEGVGIRPRADSPGMGFGLPTIAALTADFSIHGRAGGGTAVSMTFGRVPA